MEAKSIKYVVERTKNRHSRALLKDGTVVIRLAKRLSTREEQRHIEELLSRMAKMVVRESKRSSIDPFRPILEGADSLSLNLPIFEKTLEFKLVPGKRSNTKILGSNITLSVAQGMDKKKLQNWLWKILATVSQKDVERLVREINSGCFEMPVSEVRIRHMKTQWGSCSSRGVITLNTALLCVEPELFEYVVVHELAHRIHHNHSARFWNAVEKGDPQYVEHRKKLREYRI